MLQNQRLTEPPGPGREADAMTRDGTTVDSDALRQKVLDKYQQVATNPEGEFHFHTGRSLSALCGYDAALVDALPDEAVESFAGVACPFALRAIRPGERVVDVGSGAGMDSFLAGEIVGAEGHVVGIEMTPEMLTRARQVADKLGVSNVEFRPGVAEELPIEDGWADVVIANGVLNLVADKQRAFREIWRVLRAGGVLQFADIATGLPVTDEALRDVDLWAA
jgi:SAM-dependent methyltransferase